MDDLRCEAVSASGKAVAARARRRKVAGARFTQAQTTGGPQFAIAVLRGQPA